MRKFLPVLLISFLGSATVASAAEGTGALVDAITLCSSPNNPYHDGLIAMGGNLFQNVKVNAEPTNEKQTITAEVWNSAHALNQAIMRADFQVGTIELKMGYEMNGPDQPLVCNLTVTPTPIP
jgi:hypothetical protein